MPFVRIEVSAEAALVAHHARQFADDPVGKLQPLDDVGLVGVFRRHFLQGDLGPDGFPSRGIDFIHRAQVVERKIAFGIRLRRDSRRSG